MAAALLSPTPLCPVDAQKKPFALDSSTDSADAPVHKPVDNVYSWCECRASTVQARHPIGRPLSCKCHTAQGMRLLHACQSTTPAGQRVRLLHTTDECSIWLATYILPHEGHIRAGLRRYANIEADDIIHEAYVVMAQAQWSSITNPRAYFVSVCRNLVMQHYRRARVVPVTSLALIQADTLADTAPSAEQVVSARQEMRFLEKAIAKLPARCRDIFVLRRARGLTQKECAAQLSVSENIVEKQLARALVFLSREYAQSEREMTVEVEQRPRLVHSRKHQP